MKKLEDLIKDIKSYKYALEKPWYYSKTFWINLIAISALIAQVRYGFIISAEEQVAILAVINLIVRAITKQELVK